MRFTLTLERIFALKDLGARNYAFRFTFWFILLCSLVLGLNVAVNPYGIYGTHWLNPVVWSDRREKLELLQAFRHGWTCLFWDLRA